MDDDNYSSQGSEVDDMDVDDILDATYTFPEEFSDNDNEDDNEFDEEEPSSSKNELNFIKLKIISNNDTYSKYITKERKTTPYLTKFERTRVLGLRATQIEGGAPTLLSKGNFKKIRHSIEIAEMEFNNGLIPFIIRRFLPDGQYEDWKLSDFHNVCSS